MPDGDWMAAGAAIPPAIALNRALDLARAGDIDLARDVMRRLAARYPEWDEPPLRMAQSLRDQGNLPGAVEAFRAALAVNPNREQALLALGASLLELRRPEEAQAPLLRYCGIAQSNIAQSNVDAWTTLGRAFLAARDPGPALGAFAHAQRLTPRDFGLAHLLADAAIAAGRGAPEAVRQEALSTRDPLNPVPHVARGLILDRIGLLDPAIDALEAAVALAPAAREPIRVLAGILSRSSRAHAAEDALRKARAGDPGEPRLINDHAAVLMRLHRHAEARELLSTLLRDHGPHASVLCNLANATTCAGLQDEAVELARAAIALEPEAVLPRRALANTMPYQDGVTGASLLNAAKGCAEILPRGDLPPLVRSAGFDGKLTVGLLSGTLRTHPVGWLTVAGFEHLDAQAFDIVCLSRAPEPGDPIAWRFHTRARSWENVSALSDEALAKHARSLNLDILVDLGGHGDAARMTACARRLAPVQIKWVGMQNHSTGLAEMDWFLTDRWETPPALEGLYSERMLRMPDGYVCYSPPSHAPDVAPPPALRNGHVTFGCFNNIAKIVPRAIVAWSKILRAVPNSRLILKTHQLGDAPTAQRFRDQFAVLGIDPARIETRGASPHRVFLASYNDVDIVLDPFPYCGGLTTCEALWMGVPTVTLPGEIFASRHSASHLSNAGYADWVARDLDDYIAIAVARSNDIGRLAAERAEMRSRVRASPLCDAPRFGRALGAALRHAWTAG